MSKLTATLQKALDDYSAFLDAGASYAESMRNAAKALGETPCPTFIESLAQIHAAKYKCNYTWNKSGAAVFHTGEESTRETRQHAATKSWQRNVAPWFTPEKPKAPKANARVSREARTMAKALIELCGSVAAAKAALAAV
jgi:hypothetical protein